MPFFVKRVFARVLTTHSWAVPIALILMVFLTSWPLMALAEPAGSEVVQPVNYWWYFVVTAATVGYGDFSPATPLGHVVGGYVIVGGITALTTVFTRLATAMERAKGQRMRGSVTVEESDHVVLLGYTPSRTERIVAEVVADGLTKLVLCAWDEQQSHPMPEQDIHFVRGDLTGEDTLRRAGVHRARTVLVDARDDNEAIAIAIATAHVNPRAHLVVALRELDRASLLRYVDEKIRFVQWHARRMITEELVSPGIAEVYAELMTAGGRANTYSAPLPAALGPVSVRRCQTGLGDRHGATVLAARINDQLLVNPSWQTELPAGAMLYYVGDRRLTSREIADALSS
ncbi:MAG TPA: ion channel [Actinophytocola sp.]|nr:ion channel [Actinophytocola sp.]